MRSMHADAALRAALLVDLRLRGNHDAYENGETVHVRVSTDEQRRKVQCSSTILASLFWAGARPRRFPAGRFHTQFLALEHCRLVEIGCRRRISSSGYGKHYHPMITRLPHGFSAIDQAAGNNRRSTGIRRPRSRESRRDIDLSSRNDCAPHE
jgi:hypothetical protein